MRRTFDYNHWANREEVSRLRAIDPPARAIRLLAHLIGTEWLWLARLRGTEATMAVWPELSLDAIANELDPLRDAWRALLAAPPEGEIAYVNSKGERWTSRVDDVLTHVVLHGAYHRGQIAIVLRDGGDEPAYTDFIHGTRIGAI
jgi:uncharacterized damage-inducible protein DinB